MEDPRLADLQAEHHAPPVARHRWRAAEAREASPVRNYVRDLILGFNDGLVSVYAVVAGIVGASFTTDEIAVAGLAASVAGALSMGLGEYLSTKSQAEFYDHERRLEAEHIADHPELERRELEAMLVEKGISAELARQVADEAAQQPAALLELMMREEFGLAPETDRSPLVAMGVVMVAFVIGAALPVAPFFLPARSSTAFLIASLLSLGGLLAAGAGKARLAGLPVWRSGLEMAVLGAIAAAITYAVGALVGVSI